MKVLTVVGAETKYGLKYSDDLVTLYNLLDKSELENYKKETGINVRFVPTVKLSDRMRGKLLVLVDDTRAWGFAQYRILTEDGVKMMTINSLIVDPQSRGKGYGSDLIDALQSKARKENCTVIHLSVGAGNTNAKSLYDKKGFKVGAYQMYWKV